MRTRERKTRTRPVTSPHTTTTSSPGLIAPPGSPGETTVDLELSHQAFHELWKHFQLGTKPLVLNVLPDGITQSNIGELVRAKGGHNVVADVALVVAEVPWAKFGPSVTL